MSAQAGVSRKACAGSASQSHARVRRRHSAAGLAWVTEAGLHSLHVMCSGLHLLALTVVADCSNLAQAEVEVLLAQNQL